MNPQNQILEFAFQNTIPEFRERFSQDPRFVLTNIYDENHDCHIYLPKNQYRGRIAEYDFRIIQIVNNPSDPHINEIQHYHNHNHNGRIVPECIHSHKHRSETDIRKWTQVLNTYLRFNQQNQPIIAEENDFEDEEQEVELPEVELPEFQHEEVEVEYNNGEIEIIPIPLNTFPEHWYLDEEIREVDRYGMVIGFVWGIIPEFRDDAERFNRAVDEIWDSMQNVRRYTFRNLTAIIMNYVYDNRLI